MSRNKSYIKPIARPPMPKPAPKQKQESEGVVLKTPDEIAIMREAGRIVARAHAAMKEALRPGVSTWELDNIAETVFRDHGATPAFLNYRGGNNSNPPFPSTITASINHELVHGIPSKTRLLKEGDIISLDTACIYKGFIGDSAWTWAIGEIPPAVQRLLDVAEQSLWEAIKASRIPNSIREVARATQNYAEQHGYTVARDYTGHGVGRKLHEEPQVPNWWHSNPKKVQRLQAYNPPLAVGMTYAIEPMVIAGREKLKELADGWTVVTADGSLCAHFEHTIAITDGEPIVLTLP
jgi:methionyl aminopeptidase